MLHGYSGSSNDHRSSSSSMNCGGYICRRNSLKRQEQIVLMVLTGFNRWERKIVAVSCFPKEYIQTIIIDNTSSYTKQNTGRKWKLCYGEFIIVNNIFFAWWYIYNMYYNGFSTCVATYRTGWLNNQQICIDHRRTHCSLFSCYILNVPRCCLKDMHFELLWSRKIL